MRRLLPATLLAALVLLVGSCRRAPRSLSLGMRSPEDRARLVRGWSGFERGGDPGGEPFCWVEGTSAKVFLGTPLRTGTASLRVVAWPYAPAGLPPQRMRVFLNGLFLRAFPMPPGRSEYVVDFPAELFSKGTNDLYLVFDRANRPRDVEPGSADARPLAAAVGTLELRVR